MADNTTLNPMSGGDTVADDDIAGVKYQRVKVGGGPDGSYNEVTSIADGVGGVGLGVALMATNFVHSTNNSTVAQLASNATFTGVIESIFNQQTASILVTADQTGTLTINQYIDSGGTRLISSWVYTIAAGVPFSRSFTANGNYFNLTYKNTGGSTTTTLNVDTAYGTLFPATNSGNLPVSIDEIAGTKLATGVVPVNPNPSRTSLLVSTASAGVTVGSTTVDTIVTCANMIRGGSSVGSNTTFAITNGKTFRLQAISLVFKNNAAAVGTAQFTLRFQAAGSTTTASSVMMMIGLSLPATANQIANIVVPIPDGLDIAGAASGAANSFGISCLATFASTAPTIFVSLTGYEY